MSNGADSTTQPQPTFTLKAPGTAVVHAGPRLSPRIVSVPARSCEHLVELSEGSDLFAALEAPLSEYGVDGLVAEFVSGEFAHIDYVHPAYGPDAEHPMSFTQTFAVDGPLHLRHASATVGLRDDVPFCHIHASWTGADGTVRGGHLLPGTAAGPAGLKVRLFALHDARLVSEIDPETGFSAFAPHPFEPGSSDTTTSPPSPDAVISRVRPGELLDEAVLAVARNAGFTSAEVIASLGSTTGAVFADGTAPWPAVEFTHLAGTVTDVQSDDPRVSLAGEVVDVSGEVSSGTLAPATNPVAVTFELFVRRIT